MTLIATAISQYGIVHAADGRLTSYPQHVTAGRRVFALGFASAALSVTGRYEVGGAALDEWMLAAIEEYRLTTERPTLSAFAARLRERLIPHTNPHHRRMIQVAGYAEEGQYAHPELYFLRNIPGKAPDGTYCEPSGEFHLTEDFWSRDYLSDETRATVDSGGAHIYYNGFPSERLAYMMLHRRIHDFYRQVWSSSRRFRSPSSLEEMAVFVELTLNATAAFLGSGDHHGDRSQLGLQLEIIPAPPNAIRL
jgi:hypothetical protein